GQDGVASYLRPLTRDALASHRASTFERILRVFLPFLPHGQEHLFVQDDLVFPLRWSDKQNKEDFLFSLAHMDTRLKVLFYDLYETGVFNTAGPRAKQEALRLCSLAEHILASLMKSNDTHFTSFVNNLLSVYLQDRDIQLLVGEERYEYYRVHKLAA